jgi:hypothetical protein
MSLIASDDHLKQIMSYYEGDLLTLRMLKTEVDALVRAKETEAKLDRKYKRMVIEERVTLGVDVSLEEIKWALQWREED